MSESEKERPTKWAGGYIRWGKKGPTYIIEQWRGGVRFHVSTRCRTERDALRELVRFDEDPANYSPVRLAPREERKPLVITSELVLAYREWLLTRERPVTKEWANDCARILADWMEDLGGRDLRDVSVTQHLRPALDRRRGSRKHRIIAIKAFCAWLRKEKGLLRHAEDPTLDLAVPQGTAEKTRRRKVVPRERVLAVIPHLRPEVRDVLILQTGTAWHISEVRRFAAGGEIVRQPQGSDLLAVLVVRHKSGELIPTPIQYPEHLEAAERIRAQGRIPSKHAIADAMEAACLAAQVPYFTLGVMRHSVLTWAVEMGATPQQASEFAGHRSERTTRKYYIDLAVPTVRVPVLRIAQGGQSAPGGQGQREGG